ncbi:MAG: hypothetical protein HQ581_12025 [Planctomycetes bacterium]|nr:hypothetical protein [Planctomycetota bacterium]
MLLTLSSAEGDVLSRYTLDAPPVLDGLTVGSGCLFISKTNGKIACFR